MRRFGHSGALGYYAQWIARQGMAASMFTLGDIHERGDAAPKDAATALAWFAIAAEFERQTHRGTETALAKTAMQRSQTLQRILTPAELERAQQLGQSEFKLIVEALSPPKPAPPSSSEPVAAAPDPTPPLDVDPLGWPKAAADQVRVVQQALFDLKFLRDKPDGTMGPMTRAAIRSFQRGTGMREIGEPTRDVYAALKDALASRDVVANSPLPLPPPEKVEVPTVELPKVRTAAPVPIMAAPADAPLTSEHRKVMDELDTLFRRSRLIHTAITLSTICGFLVCLVIAMLFLSDVVNLPLDKYIAGAFVLSMAALISSFFYFLREIFIASKSLQARRHRRPE